MKTIMTLREFESVMGDHSTWLITEGQAGMQAHFKNCYFQDFMLVGRRFEKIVFEKCTFFKVSFLNCDISTVAFIDCEFVFSTLEGSRVSSSYFYTSECRFCTVGASVIAGLFSAQTSFLATQLIHTFLINNKQLNCNYDPETENFIKQCSKEGYRVKVLKSLVDFLENAANLDPGDIKEGDDEFVQ